MISTRAPAVAAYIPACLPAVVHTFLWPCNSRSWEASVSLLAGCMVHAACCMLHAACCMLHVSLEKQQLSIACGGVCSLQDIVLHPGLLQQPFDMSQVIYSQRRAACLLAVCLVLCCLLLGCVLCVVCSEDDIEDIQRVRVAAAAAAAAAGWCDFQYAPTATCSRKHFIQGLVRPGFPAGSFTMPPATATSNSTKAHPDALVRHTH